MHAIRPTSVVAIILAFAVSEARAQQAVDSFAALQPLVKTGQRIIVTDEKGDEVKGRVVSISGKELEIRRRKGWFAKETRVVFAEQSVRRVEHDDSTLNGLLIGAAAAALGIWAVSEYWTGDESGFGVIALLIALGPGLGKTLDDEIHRPLFIASRSGGTPARAMTPSGPRLGLSFSIRF